MKSLFLALVFAGLTISASAQAKGCLKGMAVGGVAGHYAGHHALLGMAGGCIVGHHMAAKKAAEQNAAQPAGN